MIRKLLTSKFIWRRATLFPFVPSMSSVATYMVIVAFFTLIPFESSPFATDQIRPTTVSAEYLKALRTANAFLIAWVSRDAESGLKLISNRLRTKVDDESWLRQFMVGLSNLHHQAFKIDDGRKKEDGHYLSVLLFSVTLYELYSGEMQGYDYESFIEIVREQGVWRVDQLPKSSDNP